MRHIPSYKKQEVAMPLSEGDVLDALSDAIRLNIDFWVTSVHVSSKAYDVIRDHIRAENILVVPGTDGLAYYDDRTDILTTQIGNSPANLDQRAQLLHECTHALIDVFANGSNVTRHTDELTSYLAQFTFLMRSNPTWVLGPNNPPWFAFYSDVVALIKRLRLDTAAGNGGSIGVGDLEPLRLQLAALPGVNYGKFKKEDPSGADGLIRKNPFIEIHEQIRVRETITSHEAYPDPSDDYLIRTLLERYAASDVAGYGKRLRSLRKDFALCSVGRAKALIPRLSVRRSGDRLSELFHDRLSRAGRAILLRILRNRT